MKTATWDELTAELNQLQAQTATAEIEELVARIQLGHQRLYEATRDGKARSRELILARLEELGAGIRERNGPFRRRMLIHALLLVRCIAGQTARVEVLGEGVEIYVNPF